VLILSNVLEGEILKNQKDSSLDKEDRLSVNRSPLGQYLIREEKDEITVLRYVYLEIERINGDKVRIEPIAKRLRQSDASYIKIYKGQEILVEFDISQMPEDYSSVEIIAKGYYEQVLVPNRNEVKPESYERINID